MQRRVLFAILLSAALSIQAAGQDSSIFPKGEIGKNTNNYTGTIWLNELNQPDSIFSFGIAQAVYAPASKLDWHIHPGGQILLITEGIGYYQEKGQAGTNNSQRRCHQMPARSSALACSSTKKHLCLRRYFSFAKRKNYLVTESNRCRI